jgi:PAS domain S-box-containing protein/putative nucleotidyltransferase with HDIG domain
MAKILIVDDHPTNRELLVTLLGYKSHELFEAMDGEQGLLIAQAERPNLIITDIVMPKMDGYEFARQVRAIDTIRDTQIIFYTSSYIVSETYLLAEACGVSIVIGKPIEPESFLEQIETALAIASNPPSIPPALTEDFHREHMRVLTDKLVSTVDELQAEIVERKQAEAALQKSQERFVSLFHSSPSAMSLSTAEEGRYLEVNDAFLKVFESTREQVIGHTIFELNTWVDLRRRDALYAALKPHGKVDNFEMALRTRTGKVIELLWSGVQMVIDGQDCLLGSAVDITERKQAQLELQESEERYRSLFENIPSGYAYCQMLWDQDNQPDDFIYMAVNEAFEKLTRLTNVVGRKASEVIPGIKETNPELIKTYSRVAQTGNPEKFETHISSLEIWLSIVVYSPKQGYFVAVFENITERKQAEKQIAQLNRLYATLSQVNQTIVRAKDKEDLYQSICNLSVQYGGFSMAWVGILFENSGEVIPVVASGMDVKQWPFPVVNIYHGDLKDGLVSTAIRYSKVVTSDDVQADVRFLSLYKELERNSYHSSAAVPFRIKGKTVGVVGLVSNQIGLFKAEEEIRLLEEMGLDISFALDTMENDATRHQAEMELQESNEHFRQLWESTVEGIIIHDQGIFLEVNEALTRMFGYRVEELIGKPLFDFVGTEASEIIRQKIKDGVTEPYEVPTYKADGTRFIVEMIAKAMVYRGKPARIVAIRDVTPRKEAEHALVESEERLRQVWESTSDAMALSDENGIVFSINPAAADLYGYTPEKIIGQSFTITLPEEDREQALEGYKVLFSSDLTPPTFETIVQRADGVRRITESTLTFLTDASGRRIAMLTTFRDITERKRTDEALIASEKRYRGLFEDSPISIWEEDFSLVKQRIDMLRERGVSDFQSYFASHIDEVMECASLVRITDVNKAALQMYQAVDAEQMLGSLRQVITANTMSGFQGELFTIAEGRTTFQWEGTDRTLMGKPIEVNLNWSVSPGHEHDYSKVIVSTIEVTERKQAEKQTQRQLERLQALRTIDIAISSSFNIKLTLEVLLSQAVNMLNTDAGAILLFHPITKTLEYAANRGFRSTTIRGAKIGLGDGYAGRAILERSTVHIPNLNETSSNTRQTQLLHDEEFIDYFCTPLIVKGEVKGALEVFHRSVLAESPEWLDFLETLAGQAAIAIENSQLFDGLQRSNIELSMAYDATIEGWSHALDLRDKETEGHSQRVTDLTIELAQAMGLGEADLVNIRRGALLHDIGKMGVPDNILLKPGKLTDHEWERMRQHPGFAYEMLSGIDYLKPALDIPYCHHEKWDGSGYPRGLKEELIPLPARIFAVVDVWDALCSDRSYRAGWPKEKALEYINSESGKHFDPRVVEAFLNLIVEA